MSNTNDPNAWHLGLRRPMGGDPLNEPVMAAIYGYKFNGELWRLNDQGCPEPLLEPMLGRWEQLHYPEVKPQNGCWIVSLNPLNGG